MIKIVSAIVVTVSFLSSPAFAAGKTCAKKNARKQVIILPPTGGANFADRSLFDALCSRGHQVTLLDYEQKSGLTVDLGIHDRLSREVLAEIDKQLAKSPLPTTMIGASLGGLYASMAFAYSLSKQQEFPYLKLIQRIVLTVAGGPLADILTYSEAEGVREQRALRLKELGIADLSQYRTALREKILYDPLIGADRALKSRVLMFNSRNDSIVPTSSQESLWSAWGKPEVERFSTGHEYTVGQVYFFYVDRIHRFLASE